MLWERVISSLSWPQVCAKLLAGRGLKMKKYIFLLWIMLLVSACTSPIAEIPIPNTTVTSAPQSTRTPVSLEKAVPGEIALAHVEAIAEGIGPRPTGTETESQAAWYIANTLKGLGYTPETQPFTAVTKSGIVHSANVMAVKPGQSPQEIIVGAHYDSVPVGTGADDNASGVGVLLEVAERIKDIPTPYTVRFILFGAEEVGLEGSKYYASQMKQEDIQNAIALVNLDSLIAGDIAYVYGDEGEAGVLRDWTLAYAKEHNLELQTQPGTNPEYPAGTTGDFSDHAPFKALGIPYTYFESTNWALGDLDGYTQVNPEYGENGKIWHTKDDTLNYMNSTFPGRIQERLNLFVTVLEAMLTKYNAS
jgi:alkaline phosphatase isozyme conversion protein